MENNFVMHHKVKKEPTAALLQGVGGFFHGSWHKDHGDPPTSTPPPPLSRHTAPHRLSFQSHRTDSARGLRTNIL